jgi:hypothetical protein
LKEWGDGSPTRECLEVEIFMIFISRRRDDKKSNCIKWQSVTDSAPLRGKSDMVTCEKLALQFAFGL